MVYRFGKIRNFNKATSDCKCGHPQICHYTKGGECVYQKCECQAFKPKGRPEYATAKRATCEYGHSHDSGLEVRECYDLHLQKQAGTIKDFSFHRVIDLPGPSGRVVAKYEIDFKVDMADGTTEWVECKGSHLVREQGWRIKWALLQDKYYGDPLHTFRVRVE
jgi:hypothetical protein